MTSKQRRLVEAVRDGLGLEEAAEKAGYGVAYAAKLLEEPAIRAAINAPDQPEPDPDAPPPSPKEVLQQLIGDASIDNRVRITAVRALNQLERDEPPPPPQPPMVIDDLDCFQCPLLDFVSKAHAGDRAELHRQNIAGMMMRRRGRA